MAWKKLFCSTWSKDYSTRGAPFGDHMVTVIFSLAKDSKIYTVKICKNCKVKLLLY